ncbi:MAG TPA: IclR family transcriptional regulator C-terminal domain-containing protein, partial [Beijerinckiaceae bacterium]
GADDAMGVNAELNIFASASGLAYLAALDDGAVRAIVEALADDEFGSLARFRVSLPQLLSDLARVRADGWARRRVSQGRADNRQAIAVAVREPGGVIGALTISWRREAMSVEDFARRHAAALRAAADAVTRTLCGAGEADAARNRRS